MSERDKIEQAITALEAQRATLGDEVFETTRSILFARLEALESAEKRSLVTVLFADISGFTAISERLDAEEVQDVMREFWDNLDQKILEHGGLIDKHMGDRVMGVWGADRAQEDDPEQAIRASLAMQEETNRFRKEYDLDIAMRIGVNTGLASVGRISSTGERNIVGDTVNLSARLERAAPGNGILISQSTHDRVRGLFELQEQLPLIVKGKAEPVRSYMVLQAVARAFHMPTRGLEGITTRTIGRDTELAILQTAFQHASTQASIQWVTISGDAGVGKSRLMSDFEHWVQVQPKASHHIKARAWPQTMMSPYYLLRSILANHYQILDSDPLSVAREKLTAGFTDALGSDTGEEAAAFVGQLIGFDFGQSKWIRQLQDSGQILKRAEALLQENLGRVVAHQPCVMLLEDLQWADEQSLALLASICSRPHPWRLMVVGAARPMFWERRIPWGQHSCHQSITLNALSGELADELVRELLQKVTATPDWLIRLLVERGGGNPYFTEELVKWLVEHGLITINATGWQARVEQPKDLSVPGTVQGVLQSRIEQLTGEEREVLQQASVVGLAFWSGAIDYIGGRKVPAEQWAELQQRNLILIQPSSQLPGENEYHFKHALLHDVAYEYTLKKQRQSFHQRAAEWFTQVVPERASEWAAVIADHYQRADERNLAAEWYERAGQQAKSVFELETAIGYFQQALASLPAGKGEPAVDQKQLVKRVQLYQGLGEMFRLEADFAEAVQVYIGMLVAANGYHDRVAQASALRRALLSMDDAKATVALGIADDDDLEQNAQLTALEINLLGAIYQILGCSGEADPYMQATLSRFPEFDYILGQDPRSALALCQSALEIAERVGNLGGEMLCLTLLGRARMALGDPEGARTDLRRAVQTAQQVEWYAVSETHRLLAELCIVEGQFTDALAAAEAALGWAQKVKHPLFVGRTWRTLGRLANRSASPITLNDQTHDARACFSISTDVLKEIGARAERAFTQAAWAKYEIEHGDSQEGKAMLQKAQIMLSQLGFGQTNLLGDAF